MARRPQAPWVSILSAKIYADYPPKLSLHVPQRLVSEARKAIEREIKLLKITLDEVPISREQKLEILDKHRLRLAEKYAEEYRARLQSTMGLNEVEPPPAELTRAEVLGKIKEYIQTRVTTQQGPRRHNEVTFMDPAISLLAEFYLNAHPDLDLQRIGMQKGSVIDLLAFIEKALPGRAVTIGEIMAFTGYKTPSTTIERINRLKNSKHPQFKLGSSYAINGNSAKGWMLEKVKDSSD